MRIIPINEIATNNCPICDLTIRGLSKFRKHLGGHLEELALFVLPGTVADFDSEEDPISSCDEIGEDMEQMVLKEHEKDGDEDSAEMVASTEVAETSDYSKRSKHPSSTGSEESKLLETDAKAYDRFDEGDENNDDQSSNNAASASSKNLHPHHHPHQILTPSTTPANPPLQPSPYAQIPPPPRFTHSRTSPYNAAQPHPHQAQPLPAGSNASTWLCGHCQRARMSSWERSCWGCGLPRDPNYNRIDKGKGYNDDKSSNSADSASSKNIHPADSTASTWLCLHCQRARMSSWERNCWGCGLPRDPN